MKPTAWLRLIMVLIFFAIGQTANSGTSSSESALKAAYLLKFAAYVEWPPSAFPDAETPLTIGVVGDDILMAELARLGANRQITKRKVLVKLMQPGERTAGVHVLFMASRDSDRLGAMLAAVNMQPILTVTQSTAGLDSGSVISFVPVDDRVRFEVSISNAERNGLKISALLLDVALRVRGRGP
ncbi:MAG: YfiR family protein [Burkholderiaceae bacterium]|nr:YfiR family protein [Burkholderiaceae bacterium]